ncbi:MAG: ATP-binding cassette domain-containing protein [Chlamydiota bacterium]
MLKVKNLSVTKHSAGKEVQILKTLDLTIPKGRVTLLLGKSGSGKTTLLRCLAHLETAYAGEITYEEHQICKLSPRKRCQLIGFIAQSFSLFPHMNVLDNCARPLRVLLGLKKNEAETRAKEILRLFDMEGFSASLPSQLSGGQQQRVAMTRALGLKPSFLLFDEPTSALDPENADLFLQVVRNLIDAGKGVVISSQDMHLASKLCDLVYFLEEGVFAESYDVQKTGSLEKGSKIHRFLSQDARKLGPSGPR